MDHPAPGRLTFHLYLCLPLLLLGACRTPPPRPAVRLPACRAAPVQAARLAQRAFTAVREARERLVPLDPELDPAGTGLIGLRRSPVTTVKGSLGAKQTTANPNWAALITELLQRAGVRRGDAVAAGLSGSFPALNIATLAALQALGARPVVIASVGASQYGANVPGLLWPDIERLLNEKGILRVRSVGLSLGGQLDRAGSLKREGRRMLREAIHRHGARMIRAPSFAESLEQRMKLYDAGGPIRVYVNIGGGAISVGTHRGKMAFRPGLSRGLPPDATEIDSVMTRFARRGVPVIHLIRISELSRRFRLPWRPRVPPAPRACP